MRFEGLFPMTVTQISVLFTQPFSDVLLINNKVHWLTGKLFPSNLTPSSESYEIYLILDTNTFVE